MTDKRNEIFNAARELFYSKGYKETNISDIVNKVGIGVGTFYKYFTSKEEIFAEVYIKEDEEHAKQLLESMDMNEDPVTMITKMVAQNAIDMNSNLILRQWYDKDFFSKLEKLFYQKRDLSSFDEFGENFVISMIKTWKAEGRIRNDLDDELIFAILKSILYINYHKTEIGIEHFPHIVLYITEFIMKGLTDGKRSV